MPFNSIEWIRGCRSWWRAPRWIWLSIPLNGFWIQPEPSGVLKCILAFNSIEWIHVALRWWGVEESELFAFNSIEWILAEDQAFYDRLTIRCFVFQFHWMDSNYIITTSKGFILLISFNSIEWIPSFIYRQEVGKRYVLRLSIPLNGFKKSSSVVLASTVKDPLSIPLNGFGCNPAG